MYKPAIWYLIIALTSSFFAHSTASSQWNQTNGPQGGNVTSLASGNGYIFAGTGTGGIFRSSDEGGNWVPVNTGLTDLSVSSLVMGGTTLIAGSENIFRSADFGANWAAAAPGTGFVYYLAIDNDVIMASTDAGVVRSVDDGLIWTQVDPWNDGTTGWPMTMADGVTYILSDLGIYSSPDYGTHWEVFDSTIFNFPLYTIFVRAGTYLVGDDDGGVWRRTDSAWTLIGAANGISGKTRCVISDGTRLLAGTSAGVFASTDDGEHWTVLNTGLADTNVNVLIADGTALYAGSDRNGVFRSGTGGSAWAPVTSGFNALRISSLALTSTELFAGTRSGLFTSSNAGSTWVFSGSGIPDDDITTLLVTDSTLLAGTNGSGVYRSTDHAASWSSSNTGLTSVKVVQFTRDDSLIYAATTTGQRLYSSPDGGETWSATNLHSYVAFPVNAIAAGNGYLYAGIFSGGSSGGIYRSSDRGTTWAQTSDGITDPYITSIFCVDTLVFAGSVYGEVFRSTDAADHWTLFNTGLPGDQIKSLLQSGPYLFAGTLGGVYRTAIDTSHWMAVNEGLTDEVFSLAATGSDLFAGTGHSSVWKRPLAELILVDVPIDQQPDLNTDPPEFALEQNYPNPFNPVTVIKYYVGQVSVHQDNTLSHTNLSNNVTLRVYDVLGRCVATLVDESQTPGPKSVTWDAANYPSGLYYYRLQAGANARTKKLLLIK